MALQSDLTREWLSGNSACGTYLDLSCREGNGWDTGDAIFRKSLMKMIYRKLSKIASLPVTCHAGPLLSDSCH